MKKPILAIMYDFDSTLAKSDMQNFGFIPALGMTPEQFWGETAKWSEKTGVERTLSFLYMMQKKTKELGIPMTKEWLRKMGEPIEFFPGVLTWFQRINQYGEEHGIKVEHYLVSSGNKEIVEGCKIAKEFKVIYGCEFLYDKEGLPVWPKLVINFTQKTQYFFRISKGVWDATDDVGVNEKMPERRIPYSNIVYIGDGMTDIPAMIVVKNNGGRSIAVFQDGKEDKISDLVTEGRVNWACKADYSKNSEIEKVLQLIIQGVEINSKLASHGKTFPTID
ncbi:MAG: haloacid dehalogenase-like hydrolase [Bacilli bacterium]|nr:haloacid dehalogenase-like hydrolase [Bacilli bacterium]